MICITNGGWPEFKVSQNIITIYALSFDILNIQPSLTLQ